MKKMRKGIVVLVVSAAAAVGSIGAGASAQASTLLDDAPVVVVKSVKKAPSGDPIAPARGSSWQ